MVFLHIKAWKSLRDLITDIRESLIESGEIGYNSLMSEINGISRKIIDD